MSDASRYLCDGLFVSMTQQTCSKCGEVTEAGNFGDLHCRGILMSETRRLLLSGKVTDAELLVSESQFNEEWKRGMFHRLSI